MAEFVSGYSILFRFFDLRLWAFLVYVCLIHSLTLILFKVGSLPLTSFLASVCVGLCVALMQLALLFEHFEKID